ncbi:NADH-quinone oxidoreductase subunit J [Actinomycetaceae bacterium MB13-C1-2]|nr:NADH-quinone oxidoreductase subunit J [Actinomycetaceae bacterium MB13-C1-2]
MTDVASLGWPQMGSAGEAALFWITAAFMVAGALGLLFFKKAAYAVLSMVLVMIGMAIVFFMLQAPFNGAVQVIVYTGAILMLFLFVIMMIGVGASDGYMEQRRGYIIAAILGGLGLAVLLVSAVFASKVPGPGKMPFDPYSNEPITALAANLFQEHWMTIQVTAALLITAAIGAVLLTHSDQLSPKLSQRSVARARMTAYKNKGRHIGQLPSPGVYATSNAVDNPAIAGDTLEVAEESIPRVLKLRGLEKPLHEVEPGIAEALRLARGKDRAVSRWGNDVKVQQSKAWGMRGEAAPTGLNQVRKEDLEDQK